MQHFFDQPTSTFTYVVHDERTRMGVVIDPVLDFDPRRGRTSEESCAAVARYIQAHDLTIPYVLYTRVHADHFIRARCLPEPQSNGITYLKIPLNVF